MKRELSRQAKPSVYRSIFVPALTYGQELGVLKKKKKNRSYGGQISFLCTVAGLSLRDRVRSSAILEMLGAQVAWERLRISLGDAWIK